MSTPTLFYSYWWIDVQMMWWMWIEYLLWGGVAFVAVIFILGLLAGGNERR